ncbi:MAG TPA: hypothetical protein VGE05_12320 [Novosphingobium sp.]
MTDKTYRVIQWATGRLGKIAIRHFAENPMFELVGAYVSNPEKAGKDAGEIAGIAPTGVIATNDSDAIAAIDADAVFYASSPSNVDDICKLLRSGKNVISSTSFFYPTELFRAQFDAIEAAAREGGVSFSAGGIHPGFAGDLLPLVLSRIVSRVDKVQVYEYVNFLEEDTEALWHLEPMGFGVTPEEFHQRPNMLGAGAKIFAQSMAMIVEGLGKTVDDVTISVEVATVTKDIELPGAVLKAGTVGAQHHEWTTYADGKPLVVFHAYYTVGNESLTPDWNVGHTRYRVVIEGDPSTELILQAPHLPGDPAGHPGYTWTAMGSVTAIPALCAAKPGVVSHRDLGLVEPRGLVRPA